jgi:hypothetical protein
MDVQIVMASNRKKHLHVWVYDTPSWVNVCRNMAGNRGAMFYVHMYVQFTNYQNNNLQIETKMYVDITY